MERVVLQRKDTQSASFSTPECVSVWTRRLRSGFLRCDSSVLLPIVALQKLETDTPRPGEARVLHPIPTRPTEGKTVGQGVRPLRRFTSERTGEGWIQTLRQAYYPEGSAMCVQGFDDSRSSAIHITYRISLRSSSLRLPRHPWFAIVWGFDF